MQDLLLDSRPAGHQFDGLFRVTFPPILQEAILALEYLYIHYHDADFRDRVPGDQRDLDHHLRPGHPVRNGALRGVLLFVHGLALNYCFHLLDAPAIQNSTEEDSDA